jgi:hypothetical protein
MAGCTKRLRTSSNRTDGGRTLWLQTAGWYCASPGGCSENTLRPSWPRSFRHCSQRVRWFDARGSTRLRNRNGRHKMREVNRVALESWPTRRGPSRVRPTVRARSQQRARWLGTCCPSEPSPVSLFGHKGAPQGLECQVHVQVRARCESRQELRGSWSAALAPKRDKSRGGTQFHPWWRRLPSHSPRFVWYASRSSREPDQDAAIAGRASGRAPQRLDAPVRTMAAHDHRRRNPRRTCRVGRAPASARC